MFNRNAAPPTVLWTCVCRNDTILAEAGEDTLDGSVSSTARELLEREPTPGWEFHAQSRKSGGPSSSMVRFPSSKRLLQRRYPLGKGGDASKHRHHKRLRGAKFHVYAKDCDQEYIVWIFACVYDPNHIKQNLVQSFLTKLVTDTEMLREHELDWLYGPRLACQESFGPVLRHYMMQVPNLIQMDLVERHIESARDQMHKNIEMLLERDAKIEDLHANATKLEEMAVVFQKKAKDVKRIKMWHNAKHGLVMGTAITAGIAVLTVPPLIALL